MRHLKNKYKWGLIQIINVIAQMMRSFNFTVQYNSKYPFNLEYGTPVPLGQNEPVAKLWALESYVSLPHKSPITAN